MRHISPTVGLWYKDLISGTRFEVVAWDAKQLTIETQHLDGEVSELDIETWNQLTLESIVEPGDWCSAFEIDNEDRLDTDTPYHPEDWSSPLNLIEPEITIGVEEF